MAIAVAAAAGASQAQAQDSPALEEVIVTASKRGASSMQDIPQSIQAFTTEDIQRRGFKGIDDYSKQIPGISIARREPGGTSVVFRGVASSGIQFGTNPSSAVYLDEQPITAAGRNPNPRLVDIQRVEALSGPQGTLFGDSSQSGTLRIITNQASTEAFEAWIDAGVHSVDDGDDGYDVSGMVNIPISDTVAVRLVGFTNQEAGYVDNVLAPSQGGTFDNSGFTGEDVNESEMDGGRVHLRWEPNQDWYVELLGIWQDQELKGFGDTNTDVGDLQQTRYNNEDLNDEWYQVGLTLEGKLGWADGLLAISYFDREFRYNADATDYVFEFNQLSNNYPYYAFYDFGGDPRGFATDDQDEDRWSIEARLSTPSDSGSRWGGLVGFFYSKIQSETLFTSFIDGLSDTPGGAYLAYVQYYYTGSFPAGPSDNFFFGVYDNEIENTAIFGEITYDITDNISITAGARWYEVERDTLLQQGSLMQGNVPDPNVDFFLNDSRAKDSNDGWVPKLNVTWNIDDDKLVYATYSEGFRSGGANTVRRTSVIPDSYDEDILENFEIGAKTQWLGGALRWNITGYMMTWDDIQIQANDPQPTVFSLGIINFPEAEINGIETDFAWTPVAGLTIDGTYAWLDAELSEDATVFGETGFPIEATEGTDLPLAPEWKASLGVEYQFAFDLLGASPYVRLDWSTIGESVNALEGLESIVFAPAPRMQDEYTTWDLRAGLDGPSWSVTAYVQNLDDERGEVFFSNRWGKERLAVTRPRTFGVSVRKFFN
ncbi:MAG: TonB-dependent receptor [Halieaceae bacterium]|jgi:outer membrane receptor protein involved in Fe transport|nr:TonB-dependent receptor [Halieaceae bacterium]